MKIDAQADALLKKYGNTVQTGPRCSVETSGHRVLIEALSVRGIPATRIQEIMRIETGKKVPSTSIQRHRRKACSCQS